ncbi:hypothetical protein, partial [Lactobacillus delbrueckii]|uniref:hypothetical protein n=1 Tax=Lactobacillus delbrueckii TaxID=1584 RepID=UPI0021A81195
TLTPNLTAFTDVDSQNLPDVMVSVQFILAIGDKNSVYLTGKKCSQAQYCIEKYNFRQKKRSSRAPEIPYLTTPASFWLG